MKNKKGFTLVELLVTLILLVVVGGIIVFNVSSSYKVQKEKEYEKYVSKIIASASTYVELNKNIIDDLYDCKKNIEINVDVLIENGLIDENIINPYTKEKIDPLDIILVHLDEKSGLLKFVYNTKEEKELIDIENKDGIFLSYRDLSNSFNDLVKMINNKSGASINSYQDIEEYFREVKDYGGYELSLYANDGNYINNYKKYKFQVDSIKPKMEGPGKYTITYSWVNNLGVRKIQSRSIIIKPSSCLFTVKASNVKVGDIGYPEYKKEFNVVENEKVKIDIPDFVITGSDYTGVIIKTNNNEKYISKEDLSKDLIFTCEDSEAILICENIKCRNVPDLCSDVTPGDECHDGEIVMKKKIFDIEIETINPQFGSVSNSKFEKIPYGTIINTKDNILTLTYDNKEIGKVVANKINDEQKYIYLFNGFNPNSGVVTDNMVIKAPFEQRQRDYAAEITCVTKQCTWVCRTEHGNRIENDKWYCVDGCGNEVTGSVYQFNANAYEGRTYSYTDPSSCRYICPRGGMPTSTGRCVF